MISDIEAVGFAEDALLKVFPEEPSVGEICALDAVALLETSRGDGWKGAGVGSNNQGADQCGKGWTGSSFTYTDTHPNADGTSTKYSACFRKYPSRLDGLIDLVQIMYVKRPTVQMSARNENWMGVSQTMHDTGYYEGFGSTVVQRVLNHNKALMRGVNRDLIALDEKPEPVIKPAVVVPITLRRGDSIWNGKGAEVAELQRELRIAADGIFGKITEAVLIELQKVRGLTPDGICGPMTWTSLLTDDYIPEVA